MRSLKSLTNAVMIVIGFFAVFFVTTKIMTDRMGAHTAGDATGHDVDDIDIGVVHAEASG